MLPLDVEFSSPDDNYTKPDETVRGTEGERVNASGIIDLSKSREERGSFAPSPDEVAEAMNELQLSGSLKELFQVSIFRRNLILMIIVWSFCTFSFFVVPFYLDTIPGNLFLMSSSTAIAEILASIICLLATHKYDTRKTVAFFSFVSCLATIGIITLTACYKGTS